MRSKSIYERQVSPIFQVGVVLAGLILVTGIGLLFQKTGLMRSDPYFSWSIAATLLLFFAIFNSILSLSYKNQNRYWLYSLPGYGLILLMSIIFCTWVSGIPISEAKSYSFLFRIFSFGYLVILCIVRIMRKIVRIAQKQDKRLRGEE